MIKPNPCKQGHEAIQHTEMNYEDNSWIYRFNCKCQSTKWFKDRDEAVKVWNDKVGEK